MVADVDDLGRQAVRGRQAAAAAADVTAAPTTAPRPRHAHAAEAPGVALVAALAALGAWLSGPKKLNQDVAVALGARPMERGELAIRRKDTPRKPGKRRGWDRSGAGRSEERAWVCTSGEERMAASSGVET